MGYVNQDLCGLYARLGPQQPNYLMYPVAMIFFFFNGELEMDIVCILGICFPSKHQVLIDVAVTAHQVPGPTVYSWSNVNKVFVQGNTKFA